MKQSNTNTMKAIGILKIKSTANCTICGCSTHRNIQALVFENTPSDIERAKLELKEKANKPYTCNICKSIIKSVN